MLIASLLDARRAHWRWEEGRIACGLHADCLPNLVEAFPLALGGGADCMLIACGLPP